MKNVHRFIEHTNLKRTINHYDIEKLIEEAKQFHFLGVCVPPFWVKKAKRDIGTYDISLATVIGYPLGYNITKIKLVEMEMAIDDGADELELVLNVSALKADMNWPKIEIAQCSNLAHNKEKILTIILDTAILSNHEIAKMCVWSADAGVDFVKIFTGFAAIETTIEHINLMRENLPANVGIIVAGEIKNYQDAVAILTAGADRMATCFGVEIMNSHEH